MSSREHYVQLATCGEDKNDKTRMINVCGHDKNVWKSKQSKTFVPVYFNETSDFLDCPLGDDPNLWFTESTIPIEGLGSQPRVICANIPGVDFGFGTLGGRLRNDRRGTWTSANYTVHGKSTRHIPRYTFVPYGMMNNYRGLPCTVAAMVGDKGAPTTDGFEWAAVDKLFAGALTTKLGTFTNSPAGGLLKADMCTIKPEHLELVIEDRGGNKSSLAVPSCKTRTMRGRGRKNKKVDWVGFQINPGSFWNLNWKAKYYTIEPKEKGATQQKHELVESRRRKRRRRKRKTQTEDGYGYGYGSEEPEKAEKPGPTLDPADLDPDNGVRPFSEPWSIYNASSEARSGQE